MDKLKLLIPGVAEYAACKKHFELAKRLLENPERNRKELATILRHLKDNADAVEFLKAEFGDRYVNFHKRLTEISSFSGLELTLNNQPAGLGEKRTQEQWLDYWRKIDDGQVMASMGDLYNNFNLLRKMSEGGTDEDKALARKYISSLRDDFDWPGQSNWLISSTRLAYRSDSLEGTITHHYRCKRPDLTKETQVLIPIYRDLALSLVANSSDGLKYLQTFLDTGDDQETIMQTFEFISGKTRDQIKVWTAATEGTFTRRSHSNRAAGFIYDYGNFHVNGNNYIGNLGRSRGVDFNPHSGRVRE